MSGNARARTSARGRRSSLAEAVAPRAEGRPASAEVRPAARGNLFAALPPPAGGEIFQTLFADPGCRVERIVSHGHASAPGDWYDQDGDEWVVLLVGAAALRFEGGDDVELKAGDWITIPAHRRHRVEATSTDALWLAVHCAPAA